MENPRPLPVIRPLRPADAEALRGLYALSLAKNPRGFVQDAGFHGDIAARADAYQSGGGDMLGLFLEEALIGFGGLKRRDDVCAELCNLHLHPEQHGQGLGKKLSLTLIERAKTLGYRKVELHVTVTQEAAIGLYRSLGFIETRRQVYHHANGQIFDTVFMELPL